MALRLSQAFPREALRFEPTPKWVRALAGGRVAVDSQRACLVWEPGNVVPVYAFPREDVRLELIASDDATWSFDDPDLVGYVAVRFGALDAWYEEEERVLGHPRDPFKRIDVRRSSRHVRIELDGVALAETRLARLLFETGLPVRFYIPPEDVRRDLLEPTASSSFCAYKGQASYWSATIDGRVDEDIAWAYRDPLPDNAEIKDLVCFYDERVDVIVDGERRERPRTQWS